MFSLEFYYKVSVHLKYFLSVCPNNVFLQIFSESLHLNVEHLLSGEMRVASADDIPGDVEVVGASDDVILDNLWNLLLNTL